MLRIATVGLVAATVFLVAYGVLTGYDELLSVGRMWHTPAIKPHEKPIPIMATGSVPFHGGEALLRSTPPEALRPPFALADAAVVQAGQAAYGQFCIHCHGKNYDGYGTVGQSFAPPPGDLRSAKVQAMAPGALFHEISYGIPDGRQPALATTMAVEDRWRVIAYVQSLGNRQ